MSSGRIVQIIGAVSTWNSHATAVPSIYNALKVQGGRELLWKFSSSWATA
jgi:F0F1-type ATP synthase beta subunit